MNKINTTLLPVSFDISAGEEKSDRIVKAPYMGASEYEWGAPQKTYEDVRFAILNNKAVLLTSKNGDYVAICSFDKEKITQDILNAMENDLCFNKGSGWSYEKHYVDGNVTKTEYVSWLSMHPRAIIVKRNDALLTWLVHYTIQAYFKYSKCLPVNTEISYILNKGNGSSIKRGKVVGHPDGGNLVTVNDGYKTDRVSAYCCFNEKVTIDVENKSITLKV